MPKTKTVLHIAPTPFFSDRGCHIRIAGIVKSLDQLGYRNVVCTYHHGRDFDGVDTRRIATIVNYTQTAAGPSKYKLLADWRLLWLVLREIKRSKPDVIHAHLHEGLMIGLVAKVLYFWKRIALVADMQGSLLGELEAHGAFEKRSWLKRPISWIEFSLLRLARTVVCSSPHSMDKFVAGLKLDPDKLFLVQDGADLPADTTESQTRELKRDLAIPKGKFIVIYTGGLVDSKGLDNLKEIISRGRDIDRIHFVVVGYPEENLQPYLDGNGLSQICTLTGQVPFEDLFKFLKMADIAIDPKSSDSGEGSGKMLNYLACGLPVLAFDTQNNKEFLPQGTALSASSKDLVRQIQNWMHDTVLIAEISAINLAHFKEKYSWDQTVRQLKLIYEKTLPN